MKRKMFLPLIVLLKFSFCHPQSGFRICFKEIEGSSQCQPARIHTCSGWSSNPEWTAPFRDDTDDRGGGCKYQWRIEAHPERVEENKKYRLCFREIEGSSQCQGTRSSCTGWSDGPTWTSPFRDDTDNRGGGCKYQWKIESADAKYFEKMACSVCFRETEGSSQCQGSRQSCSGWTTKQDPQWTMPFRDDTDNRGGGCKYQWYLDCKSWLIG